MNKILYFFFLFFKILISTLNAGELSDEHSIRTSARQSCAVGASAGALEGACTFFFYAQKLRAQRGESFTPTTCKGFATKALSASGSFAAKLMVRDDVLRHGFKTNQPDYTQDLIASFVGGASAACIISPAELVIAQQQVRSSTFFPTIKEIYNQGARLFFRGLPSIGMKDGITTTCILCLPHRLYEVFKGYTNYAVIPAGLSCGFLSAVLSHPFDTIKTIQQSAPLTTKPTIIQVAWDLCMEESLSGFYRGFFWRMTRHMAGVPVLYLATQGFTRLYR